MRMDSWSSCYQKIDDPEYGVAAAVLCRMHLMRARIFFGGVVWLLPRRRSHAARDFSDWATAGGTAEPNNQGVQGTLRADLHDGRQGKRG
jgi:hypothetical protein